MRYCVRDSEVNMAVETAESVFNDAIAEFIDSCLDRQYALWLNDPQNRSDENYSAIYKDVYDFRPR